jgi:hypothetical protein
MLFNINLNDFKLLYLSYYNLNNIEYLVVGFLLLVGSLSCVNLNKFQKFFKIIEYSFFLKKFTFLKNFIDFSFLRKQNLNNQTFKKPSVRVFKKKKNGTERVKINTNRSVWRLSYKNFSFIRRI